MVQDSPSVALVMINVTVGGDGEASMRADSHIVKQHAFDPIG